MSISVHVEPIPNGFRASTGSPSDLFAEAATADEAIAQVRSKYAAKLRGGRPIRLLTAEDVEAIKKAAARLSKNPMLPESQRRI
jgi:hypothetical protein